MMSCAGPSGPESLLSDLGAEVLPDVFAAEDAADVVMRDAFQFTGDVSGPGDNACCNVNEVVDSAAVIDVPEGCCLSDGDCSPELRCVGMSAAEPGACVRRDSIVGDPLNSCWVDSDCDEGVPCRRIIPSSCEDPAWQEPGACLAPGCCLEDEDCSNGFICWSGICVQPLSEGCCLSNENCDPVREECVGASPCDCPAEGPNCNGCVEFCTEVRGTCLDLAAKGCCKSDLTCQGTERERCLFVNDSPFPKWRVCVDEPVKGRCWVDNDCIDGMSCLGASICPCGVDCDLEWEGAGLCFLAGTECVVVPEVSLSRCSSTLTYRFDGQNCVPCENCCVDGPFGDLVFPDEASCTRACHPGVSCEPWGGDCGGTTDIGTWWRFDGTGCVSSIDCARPTGVGVYTDADSCALSCGNAILQIDFKSSGGFSGQGFGSLALRGSTMTVTPVGDDESSCETDLDAYAYRFLFEQARLVDWSSLREYYLPSVNFCAVDGWEFYLKILFRGGGGAPVMAETRWCAEALGGDGMESSLPDELLPLARWLVEQLALGGNCD